MDSLHNSYQFYLILFTKIINEKIPLIIPCLLSSNCKFHTHFASDLFIYFNLEKDPYPSLLNTVTPRRSGWVLAGAQNRVSMPDLSRDGGAFQCVELLYVLSGTSVYIWWNS